MSQLTAETIPSYDREAIFREDGPINPTFIKEAVRTLMRNLPLGDQAEPKAWAHRRMNCAMIALSALQPRDEIEVMIGVQALSAYHGAAACWRIGMNAQLPNGESTRHITAAANAARTFDSLLKALERRQAKPLSTPVGRPPCRLWDDVHPTSVMQEWEARVRDVGSSHKPADDNPANDPVWTPEALANAHEALERDRIEQENEGLDIANTEGILPGGGMIMPEDPSPNQLAYMARRMALIYKREYADGLKKGITAMPKIRPVSTGDLIP